MATTPTTPIVNLDEDIPGCEDNYYRCTICAWRISLGWLGLFGLVCSILTLATQTLANFGGLSADVQVKIAIVATVANAVGVALQSLHQYAQKAIAEQQNLLTGILTDYNTEHGITNGGRSTPARHIRSVM